MLVTSRCLLSRKVLRAVWIGSFWPKIEVFYRPELTNRGTIWKSILSIFKFRNEYYKQIGKSRWKNGVICLVSMLPSWVTALKLSKKCFFYNFVLTSARNLSWLKQFWSERSHYVLSKLDVVYYAYCFSGMSVWSRTIFEEFLLS